MQHINRIANRRRVLARSPRPPFTFIREAATLYLQEASEETEVLLDPERLSNFWRMRIGHRKNEVFAVAYLDSAYRLLLTTESKCFRKAQLIGQQCTRAAS